MNYSKISKYVSYCALGLAILSLLFALVYGIAYLFLKTFSDKTSNYPTIEYKEVKHLDIDLNAIDLTIKKGEKFNIQTNSKYISAKQVNEKLIIKEQEHFFAINNDLLITIPEEYIETIVIDCDASVIKIENIKLSKMFLSLDAGKITLNNVNVEDMLSVSADASGIKIQDGEINNLRLQLDAGNLEINSKLLGNNYIEQDTGNSNFNFYGTKDDYKLIIENELGNVRINNLLKANDVVFYGNGYNNINIIKDVGNVNVSFVSE